MRTILLSTVMLLLLFPFRLSGQDIRKEEKIPITTNWGVKAGFTAAISLLQDFTIGGIPVEQVQNDYKVGYFASVFMRINFARHFLQPEVSYNVNQCGVTFNKPHSQDMLPGSQSAGISSIESKVHSIDIPVIYGYNFIKTGPYAMSIFGGPKIRYIWRHKSEVIFQNFDAEGLHESFRPVNLSFTLGVAVAISRIFFDFRYDIGIQNISKGVTSLPSSDGTEDYTVSYKRRDNVLSFSLGLFF